MLVIRDTIEKMSRSDTFSLVNFAPRWGSVMIVEYRLSMMTEYDGAPTPRHGRSSSGHSHSPAAVRGRSPSFIPSSDRGTPPDILLASLIAARVHATSRTASPCGPLGGRQ